jgi:cytochrome c peroxidase
MRHIIRLSVAVSLLLAAASVQAALTPIEDLGKNLFFDKIASPDRQSCADCHAPGSGWTGPIPGINRGGAVYRGAVPQRFGNRKPPSAAYATTAPLFHYDAAEGLFVGGNFWDGRATGAHLGNPAADQALGPFLNPVEQNNPNKLAVLQQVARSKYAALWEQVWGSPVRLGTPGEIEQDYGRIGLSIAAYEASAEVNAFTSKFDYVERGMAEFTEQEAWGKELFEGKAMCSACHMAPLFTDYTFDNLGVPKNPKNPFYRMDEVYLDNGQPINPQGAAWIDPGLGGFLATLPESYFTALGLNRADAVAENLGKHKVPTLRNVDLRPGTFGMEDVEAEDPMGRAPDGFPKAYMHNGALKSLKEVVHFYNTRDVEPWPMPEVPENVNTDELGDLGLTDAEEDAIVAFMATLSDGFVPPPMMSARAPEVTGLVVRSPARGVLELAYRMPADGRASVAIFDVRGRRIRTLVDGVQPAGTHTIRWSSAGLVRGLYFVRVTTGTTSAARKLLVTH